MEESLGNIPLRYKRKDVFKTTNCVHKASLNYADPPRPC